VTDEVDPAPGNGATIRTQKKPPLFFLLPHEWGQLALRHFTLVFGDKQSVVPLAVKRVGWRLDRNSTIGELAETTVSDIRRVQPHGPYRLCGFSFTGILAYEVAGRLRSEGEGVEWLGLLDTRYSRSGHREGFQRSPMQLLRRTIQSPGAVWRDAQQTGQRGLNYLLEACKLNTLPVFDLAGAYALVSKHNCVGHDAPLTVFVTVESNEGDSPSLGWEEIHRGSIEVVHVGGDHQTMLKPPHVSVLARQMAASFPD
jgi:thioesterase domain-containing protein